MFTGDAVQEAAWRARRDGEKAFRLARRGSALGRLRRRLGRFFSGAELCCEGCCEYLLCFEEEGARAGDGGERGVGGRRRAFAPSARASGDASVKSMTSGQRPSLRSRSTFTWTS